MLTKAIKLIGGHVLRLATVVILACGTLAALDANAYTVKLRWERPLFREDCTPLKPEEIAKYEIKWTHTVTRKSGVKFPKASLTGYDLYLANAGRYEFTIRTHDVNTSYGMWLPPIMGDVLSDGKVIALPTVPVPNRCIPQPPPVCPYVCTPVTL